MPALIALRKFVPQIKRKFSAPFANVISPVAFAVSVLLIYWTPFNVLYGTIVITLSGIPLYFIYTAKRYKIKEIAATITSAVYISLMAFFTYYFVYEKIALPFQNGITNQYQFLWNFIIYLTAIALILTLYITVNYHFLNDPGKKHVRSGVWIVILLLVLFTISFFGPYGPLVQPLIAFPYDNFVAATIGLAFYYWSIRSAFYTEDLAALIKSFSKQ